MWELRVEGRLLEDLNVSAVGNPLTFLFLSTLLFQKPLPQPDAAGKLPTDTTKSRRKFSSFFRSLVIELDRELYGPDNHLVEVCQFPALAMAPHLFETQVQLGIYFQWHRSSTTQETDGFQVKRIGDRNVKCVIMLMLDYTVINSACCL